MPIDPKNIIAKVTKPPEPERGPVSLYFDKALLKEFRTFSKANGASPSRLLEEFMRQMTNSNQLVEHGPNLSALIEVLSAVDDAELSPMLQTARDFVRISKPVKTRQAKKGA